MMMHRLYISMMEEIKKYVEFVSERWDQTPSRLKPFVQS